MAEQVQTNQDQTTVPGAKTPVRVLDMSKEDFVKRFCKDQMDEGLFTLLEQVEQGTITARECVLRLYYVIDQGEFSTKTLSELESLL